MNVATVFGLCSAVAVGLGLYGVITNPQPLITGIVVAFAATAMAVALLLRLFQVTGQATLYAEASRARAMTAPTHDT